MTDSILRSDLQASGRFRLIPPEQLSRALSDTVKAGAECVSLECRRAISRKLGAEWMVTTKLSKTSNLIWYLSGQLSDVRSGRRLLDDEFELKGIAEDIAKGGAHSLARRIVAAVEKAGSLPPTATRLTSETVRARLAAATDSNPPDFSKTDLSGLDLSGVDFKRANLSGARLVGTKLAGANLFTVDLTDAVLSNADLTPGQPRWNRAAKSRLPGRESRGSQYVRHDCGVGRSGQRQPLRRPDHRLPQGGQAGRRQPAPRKHRRRSGQSVHGRHAGPLRRGGSVLGPIVRGQSLQGRLRHAKLTDAKLVRTNLRNAEMIQADLTEADVTGAKLA